MNTKKLTNKGIALMKKWDAIYEEELYRLREEKGDPDYFEGWCIIDNSNFVKNIEDECGLLLFGYCTGTDESDAYMHVKECYEDSRNFKWCQFGNEPYSCLRMMDELKKYYKWEGVNYKERVNLVRAMETVARCVNDEEVFEEWLMDGVADGDIDDRTVDSDLEWYCENDHFDDIMDTFMHIMARARRSGGLYCDGVCAGERETK